MIITKLIGGLGNQMFQYAVARHLALKNNVELKLDKTGFETYKLHAYGLHHLNIEEVFATQKEVAAFRIYKKREGKMWFLYNRLIADPTRYVSERSFNFDPSILKLSAPVYLDIQTARIRSSSFEHRGGIRDTKRSSCIPYIQEEGGKDVVLIQSTDRRSDALCF